MRKRNGYTLTELLTVLAILGMITLATVPAFTNLRRRSAVRAAAGTMRSIFHLTRSRAIARNVYCGLKFQKSGDRWTFAVYEDGDRDGIRNDDIKRGIDRRIGLPREVLDGSSLVSIGLPGSKIKDPDGDALQPHASPVQFGRSTICSFSPLGEATSGTIYLTARGRDLWAVRVYGATAKMRVLRYDAEAKRWTP
ncbi:MAG TPA: GspH/FimT family pseudopilin [Thermoanaerobaculia bacterium]|nr:GspH/FimT family pseudopilin [Thermoanaerobaculia bacterium]